MDQQSSTRILSSVLLVRHMSPALCSKTTTLHGTFYRLFWRTSRLNPSTSSTSSSIHRISGCHALHIPKLLANCQSLAKFSHKSSKMADLLEQMNAKIARMNVTRWNSEFLPIRSVAAIVEADLEVITSSMENPVKFST